MPPCPTTARAPRQRAPSPGAPKPQPHLNPHVRFPRYPRPPSRRSDLEHANGPRCASLASSAFRRSRRCATSSLILTSSFILWATCRPSRVPVGRRLPLGDLRHEVTQEETMSRKASELWLALFDFDLANASLGSVQISLQRLPSGASNGSKMVRARTTHAPFPYTSLGRGSSALIAPPRCAPGETSDDR